MVPWTDTKRSRFSPGRRDGYRGMTVAQVFVKTGIPLG